MRAVRKWMSWKEPIVEPASESGQVKQWQKSLMLTRKMSNCNEEAQKLEKERSSKVQLKSVTELGPQLTLSPLLTHSVLASIAESLGLSCHKALRYSCSVALFTLSYNKSCSPCSWFHGWATLTVKGFS